MRSLVHPNWCLKTCIIQLMSFMCRAFAPVTKTPTPHSFAYAQCPNKKKD